MSKKILHDSFLWKASFVNAYCNNPAWLGSPRPIIEWLEKNPPLWLTASVTEQVESREVYEPCTFSEGELFAESEHGCLPLKKTTIQVVGKNEQELLELRQWKKEAIAVMPDFQEIGKLLGIPLGHDVSKNIIPYIKKIKSQQPGKNNVTSQEQNNK